MSTKNTMITPFYGWSLLYTGPTENPIAVEKNAGNSEAYLAINTTTPTQSFGHVIHNGQLKNVVLDSGEKLYAKCVEELSPDSINIFSITD